LEQQFTQKPKNYFRENLGINPKQKNLLVKVVLRSLKDTLTKDQSNRLLDEAYAKINQGTSGYKNIQE
jgi:hypothetical protein